MLVKFAFWETAFPDKHINKISKICILGNGVSRKIFLDFVMTERSNALETAAINVRRCQENIVIQFLLIKWESFL